MLGRRGFAAKFAWRRPGFARIISGIALAKLFGRFAAIGIFVVNRLFVVVMRRALLVYRPNRFLAKIRFSLPCNRLLIGVFPPFVFHAG